MQANGSKAATGGGSEMMTDLILLEAFTILIIKTMPSMTTATWWKMPGTRILTQANGSMLREVASLQKTNGSVMIIMWGATVP